MNQCMKGRKDEWMINWIDRGWDVQEVPVPPGHLGWEQRLRDEESQDVHRQTTRQGDYTG